MSSASASSACGVIENLRFVMEGSNIHRTALVLVQRHISEKNLQPSNIRQLRRMPFGDFLNTSVGWVDRPGEARLGHVGNPIAMDPEADHVTKRRAPMSCDRCKSRKTKVCFEFRSRETRNGLVC
ncbi:uncharacterized protein PgNI_00983 [Pyricularia grisea]|uniref:Uncharacterized protein n=1 Tax=Pyricularia grisea TaxID=148305 RepID=A0A6P8BK90_PYRGI|nr:uncharacterized protein PgNI_00983 [Pyricularia grisea]TLD17311.1 hypothetical protein PgNI_00983 [Pyricularia grisea]